MVLFGSCSSSFGLLIAPGTPKPVSEGPMERINTVLDALPWMMKPAKRTLFPVPTCSRVETFPKLPGVAVGVAVAVAVGVAEAVAVGVGEAVAGPVWHRG